MGKNIGKNVSQKYSQKLRDHAKKSTNDAIKLDEKEIQKTAEATIDLIKLPIKLQRIWHRIIQRLPQKQKKNQ